MLLLVISCCLLSISKEISETLTESQKLDILNMHNKVRSNVLPHASNMNRLEWDDDLENISLNFAKKCLLKHNVDRHRLYNRKLLLKNIKLNRTWVGENIAWSRGICLKDTDITSCQSVIQGVKRWIYEAKNYYANKAKCSDKCSLYTQVVWAETKLMGCAVSICNESDTLLVCNYFPGGNIAGVPAYKVGDSCSECFSDYNECDESLCAKQKEIKKTPSLNQEIIVNKTYPLESILDCKSDLAITKSVNNLLLYKFGSESPHDILYSEDIIISATIARNILYAVTNRGKVIFKELNNKNSAWKKLDISESIRDISATSEVVLILTDEGSVYTQNIKNKKMTDELWTELNLNDLKIDQISCSLSGCFLVNNKKKLFFKGDIDQSTLSGSNLIDFNQNVTRVSYGESNIVTAEVILPSNTIYGWLNKSVSGEKWFKLRNQLLLSVSSCASGLVMIDKPNKIVYTTDLMTTEPINLENNFQSKMYTLEFPIKTSNAIKLPKKRIDDDAYTNSELEDIIIAKENYDTIKDVDSEDFAQGLTMHSLPELESKFLFEKKNNKNDAMHEEIKEKSESYFSDDAKIHVLPHYSNYKNDHEKSHKYYMEKCCNVPNSICSNDESDDCTEYIVCDGLNKIIMRCSDNTVFDPLLKICLEEDKTTVKCSKRSTTTQNLPKINEVTMLPPINETHEKKDDEFFVYELSTKPPLIMQPLSEELIPGFNSTISTNDVDLKKGVLREVWFNMEWHNNMEELYNDPKYPYYPDEFLILNSFEAPSNVGDYYAQRLSSYYIPYESGDYVFQLTCSHYCELSIIMVEKQGILDTIAQIQTSEKINKGKFRTQSSTNYSSICSLKRGLAYYIEAVSLAQTGIDILSVGVTLPNDVKDHPIKKDLYLMPYKLSRKEFEEKIDNVGR